MNILLAFFGWLIWNFALFSMEKDKFDDAGQEFPIKPYLKKYWDNWVLSLFAVPVLIILGIKGLGLDAIPVDDLQHLRWSDAYYLGAGAITEIIKHYMTVIIKKYRGQ